MELHGLAVELTALDTSLAETRATLATLKHDRETVRRAIDQAIRDILTENPETTNVELAAMFGLRSENSVRRIRQDMGIGPSGKRGRRPHGTE